MVMMRSASEANFIFIPSEYSGEIRVLKFIGVEEISRLFHYRLKLASLDSNINFADIIGKQAYLRISGEAGKRYVNGIVTKFVQAGMTNRYTIYFADLLPVEYLLTLRRDSRIFQELSIQDIITRIFDNINLQSDQYSFTLGNHPNREYCVQYRESDFNFISRLMEEEGIFYFFNHDDEKHVMVIADDQSVHEEIESPNISFNPSSGMATENETVYSLQFIQQIRPQFVTLRDFNYEDPFPPVNLAGLDSGIDYIPTWFTSQSIEFYDYPGGFMDRDRAEEIAQIRLQALRHDVQVATGHSVCRRFIPGYKFTLQGHPRTDFNQEYLIIKVKSFGTQPLGEDSEGESLKYSNEFECIPASVVYRPPQRTQKPVVKGVQTAFVVGPEGSDIYTDGLGRVKVEFHWDREERMRHENENRSCWIRVSSGYAGEKHGIQFTPLVNDEVIVDFLEGDPDRPIITGRVYNFINFPHLNPDETIQNIILTPYHHRLLLDDKKSSITLNTGGKQTLNMTDGSKSDLNNISLTTSGKHTMTMSDGAGKIEIKSTGKHHIFMDDTDQLSVFESAGRRYIALHDQKQAVFVQSANDHRLVLCDSKAYAAIATQNGNRFILDDTDNSAEIRTVAGNSISLNDDGNLILLATPCERYVAVSDEEATVQMKTGMGLVAIFDNDNKVVIGDNSGDHCIVINLGNNTIKMHQSSGNIEIEAPTGDVKISGKSVEIKATTELKLLGNKVELKGNSINQIKGSIIQLGPPA